eukprot:11258-Chlamydomonas_euryale.AAC.1
MRFVRVVVPQPARRRGRSLREAMLALQILQWTAARCVQSCCTTEPTYLNVETTSTLCSPGSWKVDGASTGDAVGGCISIPL